MLKLEIQCLATWCEVWTHWKRPWCWERLKAWGRGSNRGWDGWMTAPTQWMWVWANSGRWWRTGTPGVLQSMGSQRVGHHWVTEQQQPGRCHMPRDNQAHSYWAWLWQLLKPVCPTARALQEKFFNEKPMHCKLESSPGLPQLEKVHVPQWRSSTAKNKQIN